MKGSFLTISLAFIAVVLIGSTMGVFNSIAQTASSLLAIVTYNSSPVATFSYRIEPPATITVHGNQILKNGTPFIVKGMIFEHGFLESKVIAEECVKKHWDGENWCALSLEAKDFFMGRGSYATPNKDALIILKEWGVNTVRFNANQAALDPDSNTGYTKEEKDGYIKEIEDSVKRAQSFGYVVIITLFAGRNDNLGTELSKLNPPIHLNNEISKRAAITLAKKFGTNGGVILETLNEPFYPASDNRQVKWDMYINGGTSSSGEKVIGQNEMIKAMRDAGAKNVIIMPGLTTWGDYHGGIHDPLNQLAYSVHPFPQIGDSIDIDWEGRFGKFSETHPVVLSAMTMGVGKDSQWCKNAGADLPVRFLQYMNQKKIGFVWFAFDVLGSATVNFTIDPRTPATFKSCDGGGADVPADLVREYYRGEPVLSIVSNLKTINSGASTNITWNTMDATSCAVVGPHVNATGVKGMESTGHLTENATYTLTCQTPQGQKTNTVTVTVQ